VDGEPSNGSAAAWRLSRSLDARAARPGAARQGLLVTGMVAAAAGIIIQIASGSDLYPTIPPGPIILLAGAALVALGPGAHAHGVHGGSSGSTIAQRYAG
jgi:hypothetical protein